VISRSISQPLSRDALQRAIRTFGISNAKFNAVGIPEIELCQIAVQMTLAAVLVNAFHAAFKDAVKAFHGIGRDDLVSFVASIFILRMVYSLVTDEITVLVHASIPASGIGHDGGFARNIGADDRHESAYGRTLDVEAAGRTAALYQGQNDVAEIGIVERCILRRTFLLADNGFVDFYNRTFAAHWRKARALHCKPDTMAHEPRAFEGDAQSAVKLICADPFFAGANEMDRSQPIAQLDMAGLENGSDFHGKGLAASIAFVEADAAAFAAERTGAVNHATMRANAPIHPNARLDISVSCGFIVEMGG